MESETVKNRSRLGRVADLYIDGFKSMTIGRKLWALIIFKLAVMFLVLKLFFFPNILDERYDTDSERAEAVRMNFTTIK